MTKLPFIKMLCGMAAIIVLNFLLINVADAAHINWRKYSDDVFAEAQKRQQTILLYGYMVSCPYCSMMNSKTFSDREVSQIITEHYIPVKLDIRQDTATAAKYNITMTPTILFIAPDGTVIGSVNGFVTPDEFMPSLKSYPSAH